MSTDPIDTARDDTRRSERAREARRESDRTQRQGGDFQARVQSKVKTQESKETQNTREGEPPKEEGDLLSRIVEVFKRQEQGQEKGKEHERREFRRKEEGRREMLFEGREGREARAKGTEQGHARVDPKDTTRHHGDQGGGGQSGGGGGGGSGGRHSSGGGGPSSGSKESRQHGADLKKAAVLKSTGKEFTLKGVGSDFSQRAGGESGGQLKFSEETIGEIVESVSLTVGESGKSEIEVKLSDQTLEGLRVKVSQTDKGVVITFYCPSRAIRNALLVERPLLYARLKNKDVSIYRIDIL